MLELAILAVLVANTGGDATPDPCIGSSTRELEQCASLRLEEARNELEVYLAESKRLIEDDESDTAALLESQALWGRFVEADCRAAFQHMKGGSLRSVVMLECEREHSWNRVHQLWNRYLAGTTSKLPEPTQDH